ncbi:hypothetical protein ACHAXA_007040 [Cyclostephanos tholiformis]|uniref:Uncharacterized protein n=1 Tax=Cyclostephanos tholiformis TaxID=382380 RepID=A0ABD3RDH4_9STRA
MSVDPSHYLPSANGGKPPLLKLQNISARPELNGRFGQAVSYSAGRYVVAVLDATTAGGGNDGNGNAASQQPTFLKLKPENLTEAGNIDQLRFGAGMVFASAKSYISSPATQEWGQQIIAKLPPALRQRMTPNHALIAAGTAALSIIALWWIILGSIFGYTKLFVFMSLSALLLSVSSPDWVEGYKANKPIKLIARNIAINFPRRWKENLINMTGYTNISDNLALASLVIVLLLAGKAVLAPSSPSMPPRMPSHARPTPPQYDFEHIYKLGYDDGKAGNDFRASLPDDIIKYNAAQEILPEQDQYDVGTDYDWPYNPSSPPLPRSKKSSLGMGTILSMFALYRFGKDLVTSPDGRLLLDPQIVMAKLKTVEPWRLGMLGISLYRVVTALRSFF